MSHDELEENPEGELDELFCVPSEEQRFNRLVRDPGSGIVTK
jgi:hypothetical protein